MNPSPSPLLPFICPENYTCGMTVELTQNLPQNHVVTFTTIIVVVAIVCATIVLTAYAMALWQRWQNWRR